MSARREPLRRSRPNWLSGADPLADSQWLDRRPPWTLVTSAPGSIRRWWGRSLQLRVAATTLVVTGLLVLLIGVFLVNQISSGVLQAKVTAALIQAESGLETAERNLSQVSAGDQAGVGPVLQQLLTPTTDEGGDTGLFYTSIRSGSPALQTYLGAQPEVPAALTAQLASEAKIALQYAQVRPPGTSHATTALVVGELVTAPSGSFQLYYIFPLTAEEQTISLVQRTVLLAGLVLLVLTAAIAVLVTRQVVRPVRVVAETAQRLSAGDLTQRVVVRRDDEVARLGRSFNDMADSLQRQFRRLEELSRLQRRFTSDVSHELRTPLTTVRMAAEIIYARRDEFPPELSRSAELMRDELDRFEALLGDLLEISRYDAGVARLDLETVDVRDVAERAVRASTALAQSQGSALLLDVPTYPVLAAIDPRRIERILRNLLNNAIDHGEGRPIRLSVAADLAAVTISVRDLGVGLRPGEAGLVFNRFWRGDPSRSRLTGGTGLGLAIALEDARLHGGWLQAWGERGRGALFRLSIPARPDTPLPDPPGILEPDPDLPAPPSSGAASSGAASSGAAPLGGPRPGSTGATAPSGAASTPTGTRPVPAP